MAFEYEFPPELDADGILRAMERVKETVEAYLEQYGRELPDVRYLSLGGTAWDCTQLTVSMVQSYVGPPGDQAAGPQPCVGPDSVVIQTQLVRCLPVANKRQGLAPGQDQQNDFARGLLRDAYVLLQAAKGIPNEHQVIADVGVTDPQGGYQAVVLNIVMMIT